MTLPTYFLVCAGIAAALALLLSITPYVIFARRIALAAIWLALAVVPVALALDLRELATSGAAIDGSTVFMQLLEHVREYGALALPCAFVASLAMNRAKAPRRR